MLEYPEIDPGALSLGPVTVYWYGVMYVVGFAIGWWLLHRRAARFGWPSNPAAAVLFWGAVGVIAGGRIGYLLFYVPAEFFADPLMLVRIGQGGMSFHGGFLGVLIALWFYVRKQGRKF